MGAPAAARGLAIVTAAEEDDGVRGTAGRRGAPKEDLRRRVDEAEAMALRASWLVEMARWQWQL
jgi:hypothetical protein